MSEHGEGQRPELHETETIKSTVNHGVARLAAGPEFYGVHAHQLSDEEQAGLVNELKTKTEDDLDGNAIGRASQESSRRFWRKKAREDEKFKTFAGKNEYWNQGIRDWLEEQDPSDKQLQETLGAIGLSPDQLKDDGEWKTKSYTFATDGRRLTEEEAVDVADHKKQTVTLVSGIEENFRSKYFSKTENKRYDVQGFVKDIADTCRADQDQPINLHELREKLHAISGLLATFGKTEDGIDELVQDFAVSYGVLSEKNEQKKEAFARDIITKLGQEIPEDQENRRKAYTLLAQTHESIEHDNIQKNAASPEPSYDLPDEKLEEIKRHLEQEKNSAIPRETYKKLLTQEDELNRQFAEGQITHEQWSEKLRKLKEDIAEPLSFENAAELYWTLRELWYDEERAKETTEHEEKHFVEAEAAGLEPKFAVHLTKTTDGKIIPEVHTLFENPENKSDAEIRHTYNLIYIAPYRDKETDAIDFDALAKQPHDEKALGLNLTQEDIKKFRDDIKRDFLGELTEEQQEEQLNEIPLEVFARERKIQRFLINLKYSGTDRTRDIIKPTREYDQPPQVNNPNFYNLATAVNGLKALDINTHLNEIQELYTNQQINHETMIGIINKTISENQIGVAKLQDAYDLLELIENNEATAIVPFANQGAIIEPGARVYAVEDQPGKKQLKVQMIDTQTGKPQEISVDTLIDNTLLHSVQVFIKQSGEPEEPSTPQT